MIETGGQSCRLAEIPAELDHRYAAVDSRDFTQHGEGMIAGAIVNENDLKGLAMGFHDHFQAVVEVGDVLFLVVQRYDNRILWHSFLIINRNASDFVSTFCEGGSAVTRPSGFSFHSNSSMTISGLDPSRSGGPHVPAPLEVKTCIFPMRLSP